MAIAAGIGRARKSGVLIKGGAHLENLGKIKAVAFDKTGTLTRGAPVVTDIVTLNDSALELLSHVYTVERFSEHPLAKAIVKKAKEEGVQPLVGSEFTALVGSAAKMMIGGEAFFVGKPELFARWGREIPSLPEIASLAAEGKTVIVAGTEEKVSGLIAIRDEIRPEAREALGELHRLGIKLIMLTGDNETTARAIASELRIDEVRAGLKPEEKIQAIEELEKTYGAVAMVGDGINDAPALARATVGIAMGVAGTDAAIEAADIALMADDLNKLVYAVKLGRHARRIGLQNIVFSLLILGILVPSAVIGILTVAFAVFAHEFSELLAVANGLRVAGRLRA